jgi:hypothetical protein
MALMVGLSTNSGMFVGYLTLQGVALWLIHNPTNEHMFVHKLTNEARQATGVECATNRVLFVVYQTNPPTPPPAPPNIILRPLPLHTMKTILKLHFYAAHTIRVVAKEVEAYRGGERKG